MQSFSEKLEERCREIFKIPNNDKSYFLQSPLIEDDIALTLNQIDELKSRGKDTIQSLLESECYIGTELIQMEARTPRYSPYRFPERAKLQNRLGRIAEERRRFKLTHAEKLDTLHNQLLSFLKKHRQLKPKQ